MNEMSILPKTFNYTFADIDKRIVDYWLEKENVNYNYHDETIGLQGENPSGTYEGAGVQYITRNPELTNWHHGYTRFDRIYFVLPLYLM